MKSVLRVFLIAVALLSQYSAATMTWAQDDEVPNSQAAKKLPDPLTEYKGRVIAQTMHYTGAPWLTRDNREQEERCRQTVRTYRAGLDAVGAGLRGNETSDGAGVKRLIDEAMGAPTPIPVEVSAD